MVRCRFVQVFRAIVQLFNLFRFRAGCYDNQATSGETGMRAGKALEWEQFHRGRMRLAGGLLLGATFLLAHVNPAFAWPPEGGRGECMVTKPADVPAKMRDGVILKADIFRPQTK